MWPFEIIQDGVTINSTVYVPGQSSYSNPSGGNGLIDMYQSASLQSVLLF